MRVIEPKHLEQRKLQRDKHARKTKQKRHLLPAILIVIFVYLFSIAVIPIPNLQAEQTVLSMPPKQDVKISWPAYGQAAIGAVGYGLLANNGEQKAIPIASIAKVITAVAVLKVRPLTPGNQGDKITITQDDVDTYNKYYAQGQSVVPVTAGEEITQYQALEALLLPSANNIADVLVKWAFESQQSYLEFVNPFTRSIGMKNTTIADASGFSPQTISTSADLTKLAEIAMNNPVIAEVVAKKQSVIPVAGEVYNVNRILGVNGVNGVKTGNTDQAGGCFMFSAKRTIDGNNTVTIVGTIMGADNLSKAIDDSLPLIDEAVKNFRLITPIKEKQVVGKIKQLGGNSVNVITDRTVNLVVWNDQSIRTEYVQSGLKHEISHGSLAGELLIYVGDMVHRIPVRTDGDIRLRNYWWRLIHPARFI